MPFTSRNVNYSFSTKAGHAHLGLLEYDHASKSRMNELSVDSELEHC